MQRLKSAAAKKGRHTSRISALYLRNGSADDDVDDDDLDFQPTRTTNLLAPMAQKLKVQYTTRGAETH
jgi:hypothetical protein